MTLIKDLLTDVYYGRGIAVGKKDGRIGYVYFVTGRSENSKNRVMVEKPDGLYTEPFDPALCVDPRLIIYRATAIVDGKTVVTNGDHTETVVSELAAGGEFRSALFRRTYEPDGPIYTPRIAALIEGTGDHTFAILKRGENGRCERSFYPFAAVEGRGELLTTYDGTAEVGSFAGEPKAFDMPATAKELAESVRSALYENYRVSVYACYVDPATGEKETCLINEKGEK